MIEMRDKSLAVEYCRAIAALAVTWFHLTNQYSGIVQKSGSYGWLGVEAFFVLSGFVIPLSLRIHFTSYKIAQLPVFIGKRLIRLEPPYIVSILLVILLRYASAMVPNFRGAEPSFSTSQILLHFFYLAPIAGEAWLQPVYWTLAFEFVFYISAGLLFPAFGRAGQGFRWLILSIVIAACSVWAGLTIVCLFAVGVSLYRLSLGTSERLTSLAALAVQFGTLWFYNAPIVAAVGGATALIIAFLGDRRLPAPLHGCLIPLATISYSLYLVHVPVGGRVVNLGRRFIEGPLQELLLSLLALSVSIGAAYFMWRLVELPAIRLSRKFALTGTAEPAGKLA